MRNVIVTLNSNVALIYHGIGRSIDKGHIHISVQGLLLLFDIYQGHGYGSEQGAKLTRLHCTLVVLLKSRQDIVHHRTTKVVACSALSSPDHPHEVSRAVSVHLLYLTLISVGEVELVNPAHRSTV
jgi:hypothetical protein